jgi:hypothetical protein
MRVDLPIRSRQRFFASCASVVFGPIFMLGPVAVGVGVVVGLWPNPLAWLGAALCLAGSAFITYHMTQNYHWVEFDGQRVRGRRFWSRRLVDHPIEDATTVRPLGAVVRNTTTSITDAILGPIRGYEILFRQGPSIAVLRHDMTNAQELAQAVERAIRARQP